MKENYYRFGYDILGPFLLGFVSWLRQSVVKMGIKKVFFLSRDGHLMMQAYRLLAGDDLAEECRYVYFSRNSIRRSLLWSCTSYEDSLKYYSKCRYTTLNEVAAYYGITCEQVKVVCPSASEIWNDLIDFSTITSNETVRHIYESMAPFIRENSIAQSNLLKDYLQQEGISGDCALVDIGWHGSMQRYVEEFIAVNGLDATFHGFYVGHTPAAKLQGTADGWLYDTEASKMRKRVLCFFGVIEKFFQSQEGSTYSYRRDGTAVCPCLDKYEFDGEDDNADCLKVIQDGALEYVRVNRLNAVGDSPEKRMISFGVSPTLEQVSLFTFLCNKDGVKTYFLPKKGLFSYGLKEFIHALSNSAWKTGFMKMAFKLPLPYYYVYKLLRK